MVYRPSRLRLPLLHLRVIQYGASEGRQRQLVGIYRFCLDKSRGQPA